MLVAAQDKFAKFDQTGAQGQGLSIPDIYGEPQRIYRDHLKEKAARIRANEIREIKRNRLYDHIRDNILHYCQAIWLSEDPEQRILRYKKENRRVPIEWRAPLALLQIGQQIQYTPTGKDAPLWELVDPTGPLGYMGNYAVFGLRPLPEQELPDELNRGGIIIDIDRYFKNISLDTLMSRLREEYVDDDETLLDPALTSFIRQTEKEVYINPEAEEKVYKDRNMLKTLSDSKVMDFLSYLPRLWDELVDNNNCVIMDPNAPEQLNYQINPEEWGEYRYHKNGTRRFLVDSNNLYLNIQTGDGAALEPFKRAHRYLDVLKAQEELGSMKLKNERRDEHMSDKNEYDPDIEKVIIVGCDSNSVNTGTVAIHEASEIGGESSSLPVGGGSSEPE